MTRAEKLGELIAELGSIADELGDLADDILTDKSAVEPVDRSIVLFEVMLSLGEQSGKLGLMKYRMEVNG